MCTPSIPSLLSFFCGTAVQVSAPLCACACVCTWAGQHHSVVNAAGSLTGWLVFGGCVTVCTAAVRAANKHHMCCVRPYVRSWSEHWQCASCVCVFWGWVWVCGCWCTCLWLGCWTAEHAAPVCFHASPALVWTCTFAWDHARCLLVCVHMQTTGRSHGRAALTCKNTTLRNPFAECDTSTNPAAALVRRPFAHAEQAPTCDIARKPSQARTHTHHAVLTSYNRQGAFDSTCPSGNA
jgi:hypothetical protein